MNKKFAEKIEYLMEKNLPVAFLDYDIIMQIKKALTQKKNFGRKELLIIAYILGANIDDSNELLAMFNHKRLYAKKKEDAIWIFALSKHWSSASVIKEIFLQNVNEV